MRGVQNLRHRVEKDLLTDVTREAPTLDDEQLEPMLDHRSSFERIDADLIVSREAYPTASSNLRDPVDVFAVGFEVIVVNLDEVARFTQWRGNGGRKIAVNEERRRLPKLLLRKPRNGLLLRFPLRCDHTL